MSDPIVYVDTETTGILAKNQPAGSPMHPHICQIGAQLVHEGRVVAEINLLVKPLNWGVPPEAATVHGITTEMCERFGLNIKTVMALTGRLIQRASLVVAHNFPFDRDMIWTEMLRAESVQELADFLAKPSFCTQEGSSPILNLPPTQRMIAAGYGGKPKAPKLAEAYEFFAGKPFEGAHDAMADVRGCRLVYDAILEWNAKKAAEPLALD